MITTTWTYRPTDIGLFTVGFYDPDGSWQAEDQEHVCASTARARVAWLTRDQPGSRSEDDATREELRIDAAARAVRKRNEIAREMIKNAVGSAQRVLSVSAIRRHTRLDGSTVRDGLAWLSTVEAVQCDSTGHRWHAVTTSRNECRISTSTSGPVSVRREQRTAQTINRLATTTYRTRHGRGES